MGAPEVDPRTHAWTYARCWVPRRRFPCGVPHGAGPHHRADAGAQSRIQDTPLRRAGQVKDFIQTLLLYGGYNELADILVNLTSLATEMGRLVSEGYVLTVLAPNDEAMARLTTDQLSEPGSPENILYYHMIPEYQTEESMYNAVRRFGKVRYDTLRLPHKVVAREADGSVKFGQGEGSAYLFDPDIYTDGRISVQGIDAVLFAPDDTKATQTADPNRKPPAIVTHKKKIKLRRGQYLPSDLDLVLSVLLVSLQIAQK